ncbi:MAG: DNA polymerase III subunit delta' [Epsilonproteobacteria bacterium]|nr:DNA polymerase III subunit delta' [Campylobacterota bacterium]
MKSGIILSSDFEKIKKEFANQPQRVIFFERDEFKVEDVKEVIQEAFISLEPKTLILLAKKFNLYAQNALLKVVEEPPLKTSFILVLPSKSSLLPTILSRLPILKKEITKKEPRKFDEFNLETLYSLVKEKPSKEEAKLILEGLIKFAIDRGVLFTERELEYFSKLLSLLELNSNPTNLIIGAGLTILEKL